MFQREVLTTVPSAPDKHRPDTTPMKLTSQQMASFVARGFLRFDGVVPAEINEQFLREAGTAREDGEYARVLQLLGELMATNEIPEVRAGVPLASAYAQGSALQRLLDLPVVRGALDSLVGPNPTFDHHFLHVTFPDRFYAAAGQRNASQHLHQDSTIDPRDGTFDVQVMYYPHEVTRAMGGTRFVPGTHLRKVSEVAIGRYQNIRGQQHMTCPAGTLLFLHHGMWHGAGVNHADRVRYMFKIRMNPTVPQVRLWDTSDLPQENPQRPIFFVKHRPPQDTVDAILTAPEPWFEQDTGRLEFINRAKLWRSLTGDAHRDVDYWLTRIENEPAGTQH